MEEERKICTPQHSINRHVPQPNELQYNGAVCDCKKLKWVVISDCPCKGLNQTHELIARPNQ